MNSNGEALIIGASYAGLSAALALRCIGYRVAVLERSSRRLRTGGGIVVQHDMARFLEHHDIVLPGPRSIPAVRRNLFEADGSVESLPETAAAYSAWDVVLADMEAALPAGTIERGVEVVTTWSDDRSAGIVLGDGTRRRADLVVAADGIGSPTRRDLAPGVSPAYTGYVAWRGMVDAGALPPAIADRLADALSIYTGPETNLVAYEIPGPGGETHHTGRRVNWVWYDTIPPGRELDDILTDLGGRRHRTTVQRGCVAGAARRRIEAQAARLLPPLFRDLVLATKEPFVQAVEELLMERLVYGRRVLIGDAASLIRPHLGAGTDKAVGDALALALALEGVAPEEINGALASWEGRQVLRHAAMARAAEERARGVGLPTGAAA